MNQKGNNTNNQLLIAIGLFVVIVLVGVVIKLSMPAKAARSTGNLKNTLETTAMPSAVQGRDELEQETQMYFQESGGGTECYEEDGAGEQGITEALEQDAGSQHIILTDEYVLPYSDSQYYTEEDLEQLTQEQIRIARNEIYARKGRKFKDEQLQEYFNNRSWYEGSIEPDRFNEQLLNSYEIANRNLITSYEEKKGYR